MCSLSSSSCFLQMTHGAGSTWTPAGLGTATKAHNCNGLAPLTGACLSANSHCVTGPAYWAPLWGTDIKQITAHVQDQSLPKNWTPFSCKCISLNMCSWTAACNSLSSDVSTTTTCLCLHVVYRCLFVNIDQPEGLSLAVVCFTEPQGPLPATMLTLPFHVQVHCVQRWPLSRRPAEQRSLLCSCF